MVKKLTVSCTQCHQVSDLFLSGDAHIIIFNCPACWTPLLYFKSKVHILSERQLDDVKKGNPLALIQKILQSVGLQVNELGGEGDLPAALGFAPLEQPCLVHASAPVHDGARRQTITADDILNLRIDLANTRDVREFLAHMG